jgi:response regulator NasT
VWLVGETSNDGEEWQVTKVSPHRARILIADDESLIRIHLRELLVKIGYDVVAEAANGAIAIDLVRKTRPDVVLMDIKMPDSDGLDAARQIVQARLAPVVLLTAFTDDELVSAARTAGVSGYIVKPVRETELAPVIEIALARFTELEELRAQVEELEEALETRKLVERAKGVLMETHGLSEGEAFHRMRKTSMDTRKSMKEVAEAIILSHKIQTGAE